MMMAMLNADDTNAQFNLGGVDDKNDDDDGSHELVVSTGHGS